MIGHLKIKDMRIVAWVATKVTHGPPRVRLG